MSAVMHSSHSSPRTVQGQVRCSLPFHHERQIRRSRFGAVAGFVRRHNLTSGDFLFPASVQFLLVSVIFIVLDIIRMHDAKPAAAEPPDSHLPARPVLQSVVVKRTLRDFGGSERNSARGMNTWNS